MFLFNLPWVKRLLTPYKRVNRKVWSRTKTCYYILHECLLLGNNQFLKTTISSSLRIANYIKTSLLLYLIFNEQYSRDKNTSYNTNYTSKSTALNKRHKGHVVFYLTESQSLFPDFNAYPFLFSLSLVLALN